MNPRPKKSTDTNRKFFRSIRTLRELWPKKAIAQVLLITPKGSSIRIEGAVSEEQLVTIASMVTNGPPSSEEEYEKSMAAFAEQIQCGAFREDVQDVSAVAKYTKDYEEALQWINGELMAAEANPKYKKETLIANLGDRVYAALGLGVYPKLSALSPRPTAPVCACGHKRLIHLRRGCEGEQMGNRGRCTCTTFKDA